MIRKGQLKAAGSASRAEILFARRLIQFRSTGLARLFRKFATESSSSTSGDWRMVEDEYDEPSKRSPSGSPAVEEAFGDFDEPQIRRCRADQKDEEHRWRRHKTEPPAH